MGGVVCDRGSVRQEPGVHLDRDEATLAQLLGNMIEHRSPHVHLRNFHPKEKAQILGGELEESPLIAFEVAFQCECSRRQRIEIERMEHLDPEVHVAIRLRPCAVQRVERMSRVVVRVERQELETHGQSRSRRARGQSSGSRPCARRSASTILSRPNPMQDEWAKAPSALVIPNAAPK